MQKTSTRYLTQPITRDLQKKMVLLGGPRQVGKTTLAMGLLKGKTDRYFNWDFDEDREKILKRDWPALKGLIVFDELHKYHKWRNLLKGLFDKWRNEIQILVTGSARLEFYRYSGDSLQGRYYSYHMHPLSMAELKITQLKDFNDLLALSGFPEPFFSGDLSEKKRWAMQYRSRLIREDVRDLERVSEIGSLERLALRLPELVGSPLSLNNLREDLQMSHATISRWCDILERLYYLFRIYPFGAPKIRAVKKTAKHYHYDWSLVTESGPRLENLVASHLLKWCHFEQDTLGRDLELRYFRDIDRREVDFVILEEGKPIQFIECKNHGKEISRGLVYLKQRFPKVDAIQLTLEEGIDRINNQGIRRYSLIEFLASLH